MRCFTSEGVHRGAGEAKKLSRDAADSMLKSAKDHLADPQKMTGLAYAALALQADAAYAKRARAVFESIQAGQLTRPLASIVASLLSRDGQEPRGTLESVLSASQLSQDQLLLLALACRREGGPTWSDFRLRLGERIA